MMAVGEGRADDREPTSVPPKTGLAPAEPEPARLTREQRSYVQFVLDVVGLLAARYGFDPAQLVDARTGASFGPSVARMRRALECSDSHPGPADNGCGVDGCELI